MSNELKESEFLLYSSAEGGVRVNVRLEGDTLWLTQKAMGELFDVETNTINYHLKEIFKSGELLEGSTIRKFRIVQKEGNRDVTREVEFYNLDAIISVGYRVNSTRATQFRIWATRVLREYIIKGFVLDDDRLKQGEQTFGKDYFKELLERVRSIRASERRIYQQITDIFAECSIDYDKNSEVTKNFYAMVQNKFHYAITGQTAPEIIHSKVDSKLPHAGLQTWKNAPEGRVLASDVTVAKNYLKSICEGHADYQASEFEALSKEFKEIERKKSKLLDLLLDGTTQSITQDIYDEKMKELQDRQHEISIHIEGQVETDRAFQITLKSLLSLCSSSYEIFKSSNIDQKRKLMNFVLSNLQIKDGSLCYSLRKPFDELQNVAENEEWRARQDSNLRPTA